MELSCKVCNKFIIDNYTITNKNLDEIDKILNDYVTIYNKKFDKYAIRCQFLLVFANSFKIQIETDNCPKNNDLTKIKIFYYFGLIITKHRDTVFVTLKK